MTGILGLKQSKERMWVMETFTTNLTESAKNGELKGANGREKEIG